MLFSRFLIALILCWNSLIADQIALLFLTRGDLNHGALWQTLLEQTSNQYQLYFHSKDPLQDSYFHPYRIDAIVPTSWSVHARAWQELLKEALKNKENKKFVFLSESCVPLYDLNRIYQHLVENDDSYLAYGHPWWPKGTRDVLEIHENLRFGSHEWAILNRHHAEIVAQDDSVIHLISRHDSDQESYFATLFALHGVLETCIPKITTYVNWELHEGSSPMTFREPNDLTRRLFLESRSQGCLFARKFAPSFPEDVLLSWISED